MTEYQSRRSPLLPLAILGVLLAGLFTVTAEGFHWFWADTPWLAALIAAAGLALGVLHFALKARSQS